MSIDDDTQKWMIDAVIAARRVVPRGVNFMLVAFGPNVHTVDRGCIFATTADKEETVRAAADLMRKMAAVNGQAVPEQKIDAAPGSVWERLDAYASGADELEIPALDADVRAVLEFLRTCSTLLNGGKPGCGCHACRLSTVLREMGVPHG